MTRSSSGLKCPEGYKVVKLKNIMSLAVRGSIEVLKLINACSGIYKVRSAFTFNDSDSLDNSPLATAKSPPSRSYIHIKDHNQSENLQIIKFQTTNTLRIQSPWLHSQHSTVQGQSEDLAAPHFLIRVHSYS